MTSRVSVYADDSKSVTGLADAISGLDKEVVNEVILNVATSEEKSNNPDVMKIKLEVLEQQNELIEEEKKEREATAMKADKEKVVCENSEKDFIYTNLVSESISIESDNSLKVGSQDKNKPSTNEKLDNSLEERSGLFKEVMKEFKSTSEMKAGKIKESKIMSNPGKEDEKNIDDEQTLSTEEIDAISQLVSPDPVQSEREILERIKAAIFEESRQAQNKAKVKSEFDQVNNDSSTLDEIKPIEVLVSNSSVEKDEKGKILSIEEPHFNEKGAAVTLKCSEKDETLMCDTENSSVISIDGKVEVTQNGLLHSDLKNKIDRNNAMYTNAKLNKAIQRLKSKVESMVGKIEIQLSNVEAKIGDKLHYLDKDMDGILSREEMVVCLQSVLKRSLTFDEAMTITADMDENEDGLFSIEELLKWLETSKLVKLVEEGRDAEVDKILSSKSELMKQQKENNITSGMGNND